MAKCDVGRKIRRVKIWGCMRMNNDLNNDLNNDFLDAPWRLSRCAFDDDVWPQVVAGMVAQAAPLHEQLIIVPDGSMYVPCARALAAHARAGRLASTHWMLLRPRRPNLHVRPLCRTKAKQRRPAAKASNASESCLRPRARPAAAPPHGLRVRPHSAPPQRVWPTTDARWTRTVTRAAAKRSRCCREP